MRLGGVCRCKDRMIVEQACIFTSICRTGPILGSCAPQIFWKSRRKITDLFAASFAIT